MNAPELRCAIRNVVQLDVATIFGGLSGQAKTWILLSIAKALLKGKGTLLWNHFPVEETAEKIAYLIPESTIAPFAHRLRLLRLMEYVENGRLLTRTLSKGPRLELDDPRLLLRRKTPTSFSTPSADGRRVMKILQATISVVLLLIFLACSELALSA